ncbi:glycerol-3-phosphate dehydrogenase [Tropicimonas isoalkanivorans]|uniref:Glycerol-3-phosphate dehydrogenase n=1 Tax=Tropicimonas isoalkanivorans TaxID=441112 RepID=A0A1I1DJZ0_9RHOB|nr:glycerol-3-phosphate dehydrogenase [Tropicimonas isoalkanivorans]SFB73030.1 homodimeric glycerol 3-phosphate dehydrogenase (quinone) [Tropicimonas isoalkanivorans]
MASKSSPPDTAGVYDLFVIGGGVNGSGIARDAAGRGLSVALAEMNDLASATSSASTKLFHGGLRYLEYFEIRLVREALAEREVLLRAMPHISWPMRFVLPIHKGMRFDTATPASKLLSTFMPWTKGRRPAWMIRMGLFMYDTLGGREILPGTAKLDLTKAPEGRPLKDVFKFAYEYSDCWVEDSRLVLLNARDAAARGARIMTRTRVISAERQGETWQVAIEGPDGAETIEARALVNAGGPWVDEILHNIVRSNSRAGIRLVRGSHIVTRKLYDHDKCYFFQGSDGRIVFAIPYEQDFTLIGTTDMEHHDADQKPVCTDEERDYLLKFVSNYFATPVTADDIVWTYSGVRPLYDDGASSATAATRDYVLTLDDTGGAPLLSVFGGKITTYRRLAEAAMDKLSGTFPSATKSWTAGVPLPGGDFPVDQVDRLVEELKRDFPFLDTDWAARLIRTYGTEARDILGDAKAVEDLGEEFGATITARELDWAIDKEWVRTGEDFLWRRTRLGLRLDEGQMENIDRYVREAAGGGA